MVHFSGFLAVKKVDLILLLKLYVVSDDLHNLKILLCECKMSFKIGSLRCVTYWDETNTLSPPTPATPQGKTFSPKFGKGIRKKVSAWEDLKSSFHRYFRRGKFLCFLAKKDCKIKYDFEDSI